MLTHPDLNELRAYASDEAESAERRRMAEHLIGCADCRGTLQWVAEVRSAAADAPQAPTDTWDRISARIAAGEIVLLPDADELVSPSAITPLDEPHPRASWSRGWRVAALGLLIAGGAAAAVPGSWLRSTLTALFSDPPTGVTTVGDAASARASAPPPAVVALVVEPANGAVRISLQQPHAAVTVRVRLSNETDLQVEALAGAAAATFRTSPGRLEMIGGDSGSIVLTVPMTIGRVHVDVDGRTLLLKDRGEIRILAPSADTVGSEFVLPVRTPGQSR